MARHATLTPGQRPAFRTPTPGTTLPYYYGGAEAMAAGMRYNSERILQGSRQFRRGYAGPVTAQVHDFDQRLRATFF
jgi:hypothetical protein